ncbi:RagB/SusD family nutrient uptake outer membrane protein [Tellurirhabdus rosea]|uniref:RagB/SusD family nutrient uptake outer membrane protein n=1 Tax=Tellurirhabdus rosea TaxID=2674997 RepID=UPI00225B73EE|nr:RagB/SusD family nutrient uptake outer membrane protein [Tellurirhabdus rosea]
MKKLYALLLCGSLLTATSCNDMIDLTPTHSLSSANVFGKLDDFEPVLNGTYASMRDMYAYGLFSSVAADMMSDNLIETNESLVNYKAVTDWTYAADQLRIGEVWRFNYLMINDVNLILENIAPYEASAPKKANRIKGQALAIRGLLHFNLLQYYAPNFDRNSTSPGVPVKTTSKIETPARATVKQVYDQIIKDLEAALPLLNDVDAAINTATKRSRIDAATVNAILARVSLYAKEYDRAITYATAAISARPLATRANFPGIWSDANADEVLFAIQFNPGEGGPALDVWSPATNRSQWEPAATLLSTFDRTNDVRFASYFTAGESITGSVNRAGRFVVTKYQGKGTARDGAANFKAFRTGEMYLIRAEARALTNRAAEALADLNTLRAARIANFAPGTETGQALIDAIALERRKELWMEGHRWFDLKRTTRVVNRADCRPGSVCTLAANSPKWAWPIPQGEILANPSIAGAQNDGY